MFGVPINSVPSVIPLLYELRSKLRPIPATSEDIDQNDYHTRASSASHSGTLKRKNSTSGPSNNTGCCGSLSLPRYTSFSRPRLCSNGNIQETNDLEDERENDTKKRYMCPICFEEIGMKDLTMKCELNEHLFHYRCLSPWVVRQYKENQPIHSNLFRSQLEMSSLEEISDIQEQVQYFYGLKCTKQVRASCPMCRDEINIQVFKLKNYLSNKFYAEDDRSSIFQFLWKLRLGLISSTSEDELLALLGWIALFSFGFFKGSQGSVWAIYQEMLVCALPLRGKFVVGGGYLFGNIFAEAIRKGQASRLGMALLI